MKQKIIFLLITIMIVGLLGCSKGKEEQPTPEIPGNQEDIVPDDKVPEDEIHGEEPSKGEKPEEGKTEEPTPEEPTDENPPQEETPPEESIPEVTPEDTPQENPTPEPPAPSEPPQTVTPIDPSVLWVANCNEYISLRAAASSDGAVITNIPVGGQMELLGWAGTYAKVAYQGMVGYVASNYIKPGSESMFQSSLNVVELTATYTYEELIKDARTLADTYPNLITMSSIGTTELGRDIPVLRIGNVNARYHVLIHGGIHAREHMTSWLMMALVDYWADHNLPAYGDVCYHIIPMVNPDGVVLAQTGTMTELQQSIYQSDLNAGITSSGAGYYTATWKANGVGLDLNRNFPAGWETAVFHANPSSWRYKGEAPFTAAETIALRDYTLAYNFDTTISYHASGSLIYYQYGYKQPVNDLSKDLGYAVNAVTGYPIHGWGGVDGAGYKDWAIEYLEIPSLTVEIGCASAPLAERELYSIFVRNCQVLPAIAQWLQR